jgi:quercetin dioxygenase-like cupin family protein
VACLGAKSISEGKNTDEERKQEMKTATAKVCHYADVEAKAFGGPDSGVAVRWLIDEDHDGAPVYNFRIIEVAPGKNTPDHTHAFEHENFVLDGKGKVKIGEEWHELAPGSVVFVPPDVPHTYVNTGDTLFRFICAIPVSRLGGMAP